MLAWVGDGGQLNLEAYKINQKVELTHTQWAYIWIFLYTQHDCAVAYVLTKSVWGHDPKEIFEV